MTAANDRHRRIAASFARQYYTALLQKPENLTSFYTPDASFEHMGCKALGSLEIESAVKQLYPTHPGAVVKILSLESAITGERSIRVTIKGTMPSTERSFTHEVSLIEHLAQPGSFGVLMDHREESPAPSAEAPTRWALETPPMFAKPPAAEAMEPMEQPAATTAAPVERSPTPPKPDAAEADKPAAAEADKPAETKPLSFAEAIKSRRAAPAANAPITVVAKGAPAAPPPPAEKEKAPKSAPNGRRAAGNGAADGEARRNGRQSSHAERPPHAGTREGAGKARRDADGRALSRFVVFYDIIVKGLPTSATEPMVREIVEPTAPVRLVKLLSQNDKKDPSVVRTFAFVQLDHDAIKASGEEVKGVINKVVEGNKGRRGTTGPRIQIDEVREKYTAAPTNAAAPAAEAQTA